MIYCLPWYLPRCIKYQIMIDRSISRPHGDMINKNVNMKSSLVMPTVCLELNSENFQSGYATLSMKLSWQIVFDMICYDD